MQFALFLGIGVFIALPIALKFADEGMGVIAALLWGAILGVCGSLTLMLLLFGTNGPEFRRGQIIEIVDGDYKGTTGEVREDSAPGDPVIVALRIDGNMEIKMLSHHECQKSKKRY